MSYSPRSLSELAIEAKQHVEENIPGAQIALWPNVFRVIQKTLALLSLQWELRFGWLSRQIFASTAQRQWLLRHGYEYGILPKPAARAIGEATIATTPGLLIPSGLVFSRSDGALFRIRANQIASTSLTDVAFEAVEPGTTGNTAASMVLALVDTQVAPVGLGASATVSGAGLGGGADEEDTEAFRDRVLERKRNPPQGGSAADWRRWTKEVPGVLQAYVAGFTGDERRVWVTFTQADRANGIPTQSDVDAVAAYLSDDIRRPLTARVYVYAPAPRPVPIAIQGLASDNFATRQAIEAELSALFAERMRPALPDAPFVLPRAWIIEAVSRAVGEERHTPILPAGNLTFDVPGDLPVLGPISFAG